MFHHFLTVSNMTMTEKKINKNKEINDPGEVNINIGSLSPLVISVESTLPSLPGKFSFFKYLYIFPFSWTIYLL